MSVETRSQVRPSVSIRHRWSPLIYRNRWTVSTIWAFITVLIMAGLATAITSSLAKVHPEIIVETCSLLAAFLLVIVERLAARHAARRAVLDHVVQELQTSTARLCDQVWTMARQELEGELGDTHTGLRFYYPQLSTSAVTAAVLGSAFDSVRDFELIRSLQTWRSAAEICNSRLEMAQLLLFFLPSTEDGMHERLRLHASIAAVPVVQTRTTLMEFVSALRAAKTRDALSNGAYRQLLDIGHQLESEAQRQYDTEELRVLAQEQ